MAEQHPILKKQLSIKYASNIDSYEHFKRMMGASPMLYTHDFHYYNDDVSQRHQRNIKELRYLKKLLAEDKIEPKMLSFNTFNSFYPSYVLHHHYQVFLPILSLIKDNKQIKTLINAAAKGLVTGAFLHEKQRLDFKSADKDLPLLNSQGFVEMNQHTYFYSGCSSPYITHCAFISLQNLTPVLTIIEIRDKNGQIANGVKMRDLGSTTSYDYVSIGYNFSSVRPLIVAELQQPLAKKVGSIGIKQRFFQFHFTLKDLQKSLWITVKYCSMRRQFKTIDNSKQQRNIITYQAVSSRIVNGFVQLLALSDLNSRLQESNMSFLLFSQLLESSHHVVLESLIHLRECCGGFGFLQVSGHPGCIQRVCNRAGNENKKELNLKPEFLQMTQFYASSDQTQKFYTQLIQSGQLTYMNYFCVFIGICTNMRKKRGLLTAIQYKREYLKQTSLMAMHARQEFSRHDATNIHCQVLQYAIAHYIISSASFINWENIKMQKKTFIEQLQRFKNSFLESISADLQSLCGTLELTFLRNTIVGREDQNDFYEEMIKVSKNNLRNSKEYLAYIREPIIEMLTTNRAKI